MMTIKTIQYEVYREKAEQIEENDGDGDNHDDDDIYIMMKCLSVCHEK